ncbi:MerR family transcriptional regulator [Cohnella abietis]|uniref:HTH merR-type domain-containing protein n=1 Tax=Cohnella abietis TaxID=2507935 RepID=A0A3T1D7N4_9BACL|nr:MerR family transcriptional regulator [Cohnella abietis]BBI34084.1 hypothetical protein KCTCHS21_34830 [Cohnella abietis]
MSGYLRGQIAKIANVNIETLRYYENYGLISSPIRSEAGYRLYTEEVLSQITFIKNAKACGFTLKEIKKALTKSADTPISVDDFIAVIDQKRERIHSEMAKKEETLTRLAELRVHLLATGRNPEVQETLRILKMES